MPKITGPITLVIAQPPTRIARNDGAKRLLTRNPRLIERDVVSTTPRVGRHARSSVEVPGHPDSKNDETVGHAAVPRARVATGRGPAGETRPRGWANAARTTTSR
jgi:hypothetical protein